MANTITPYHIMVPLILYKLYWPISKYTMFYKYKRSLNFIILSQLQYLNILQSMLSFFPIAR